MALPRPASRQPKPALMRYTVVDRTTTVSFIGPVRALQGLVAACASGPQTLGALLDQAAPFTGDLRERVLSGLAVFDEHNGAGNYRWVHAALDFCKKEETPVFRVVDDRTRETSLSPVWAGADRKSTRLNSSHLVISYAVFCLKKKNQRGYSFA